MEARIKMDIENEIFAGYELSYGKLEKFGFRKENNSYIYSEDFLSGAFKAIVAITDSGKVSGKVIDLDLNEEYLPLRAESRSGGFVNTVREEYKKILEKIALNCFIKKPFLYSQTNKIVEFIKEKYNEEADHPFKKLDGYGVFRYPKNKKWYALIMSIPKYRLLKKEPETAGDEKTVEIINLKADKESIEGLLKINGIYPSYHMNRANWISILLDGSVEDKTIEELIDISRNFAIIKR